MEALYRAGFDPEGAPAFFGRLAERYRYTNTPPQFLITHPLPNSRVADTRARAMQYGDRNVETSLEFELAKARIRVRYSGRDAADILKDLIAERATLVDTTQIEGNNYGQVLALLATGEAEQAYNLIMPMRRAEPLNLFYLDTETDILLELEREKRCRRNTDQRIYAPAKQPSRHTKPGLCCECCRRLYLEPPRVE